MLRWSVPMVVLFVAGCGCGVSVQTPTVSPRAATVTSVAATGLAMRIEMGIHNPNGVDLTVRSLRAHVTAQGQDLGTVEGDADLRLPAGAETPFASDINVPWQHVPGLGLGAMLGGAVPYHVDGTVVVSGPAGVTFEVPFEMDGEMPRSTLIRLPGLQ